MRRWLGIKLRGRRHHVWHVQSLPFSPWMPPTPFYQNRDRWKGESEGCRREPISPSRMQWPTWVPCVDSPWWPSMAAGFTLSCAHSPFLSLTPTLASSLQDLHQRIDRFRASPPLEGSRFHYGFNSNYLKKVVSYWRNEFDWKKQVELLNQYPHFKTKIEGETPEQQPGRGKEGWVWVSGAAFLRESAVPWHPR